MKILTDRVTLLEDLEHNLRVRKNIAVIMRGIPGSGKSTLAGEIAVMCRRLRITCEVCSADHYMLSKEGAYDFKPRKVEMSHLECQKKFKRLISVTLCEGNLIIVDNTNCKLWELAYYKGLADVCGYAPYIVELRCGSETSAVRNVHGAPLEACSRMETSFEELLPWWTGYLIETDDAHA